MGCRLYIQQKYSDMELKEEKNVQLTEVTRTSWGWKVDIVRFYFFLFENRTWKHLL